MDHRGGANVPRRIGSAPLERHQFTSMNNRSNHSMPLRGGMDKHSHAPVPPAPGGFFDRVAPVSDQPSSYPPSCIYDVGEFAKLQATKDAPPKGILSYVNTLWKDMPENKDSRPEHIFSREDMFQGNDTAFPSKVLKDRKMHNEVLGILGRVNEANLTKMKKELTDLPIRQSTQEEIQQVIQVFFNKSIRPEDSIFTPLYVKLICHLINTIGEQEVAGKFIREAIIRQCQNTFDNAEALQEQLEQEIKDLHHEEAELRRNIFAGKQKANINFLGLLFTHGLVREKVVIGVLQWLLYGRERRRRAPADYELIHFMSLLITCGKSFTKEGLEFIPQFRSVMEELIQTHPHRRIQFLLLNAVETMDNGWEPLYGSKAADQGDSAERRPPPPLPPRNKTLSVPPQKIIASQEDFWQVMDNYFVTSNVDEIVTFLNDLPMETRIKYCSSGIGRYITNVRYPQQRARLGELFEGLANKRALPMDKGRKALSQHLLDAVQEDLFTDIPKYFSNWAAVIKGGREVFPLSMHTEFLNILVDNGARRETIVDMVRDVRKVLSERSPAQGRDAETKERFRVLPAVLRYTPPLLSEGLLDESEDILKRVREFDLEVDYFHQLWEQVDSVEFFTLTNNTGKAPHSSFQLLSAFFTFARFDVESLCHTYKEALKKVINSKQLHLFLEEVYDTWEALGRTPEQSYFQFVKAIYNELGIGNNPKGQNSFKEQIEKHKTFLRSLGGSGKADAMTLDKCFK